jgi:hypothetical protein
MARDCRVYWRAVTADGEKHEGELASASEGMSLEKVEAELFDLASKLRTEPVEISVRVRMSDDSGMIRVYKKRGQAWVRVWSDNIVPWWFPWLMIGTFVVGFVVLWLVCPK